MNIKPCNESSAVLTFKNICALNKNVIMSINGHGITFPNEFTTQ